MEYALVKNGSIKVVGWNPDLFSRVLRQEIGLDVSFPEIPVAGLTVHGYEVIEVVQAAQLPPSRSERYEGADSFQVIGGKVERSRVYVQRALDEMKEALIGDIEQWRDDACYANVTAHGRQWQADARSQDLLSNAVRRALAGKPFPPEWRDANNTNMTISSVADLEAIEDAIALNTQTAYARSWELKAQVIAATTVEQLAAITW